MMIALVDRITPTKSGWSIALRGVIAHTTSPLLGTRRRSTSADLNWSQTKI
jgi:hypothetical protein